MPTESLGSYATLRFPPTAWIALICRGATYPAAPIKANERMSTSNSAGIFQATAVRVKKISPDPTKSQAQANVSHALVRPTSGRSDQLGLVRDTHLSPEQVKQDRNPVAISLTIK